LKKQPGDAQSDVVSTMAEPAWRRFWLWLTTRQTCRECRLLRVEAEDIECRCLPVWPNGLRSMHD
jgi:hypothetical protein